MTDPRPGRSIEPHAELHPQAAAYLAGRRRGPMVVADDDRMRAIAAREATRSQLATVAGHGEDVFRVKDLRIKSFDGSVQARLYRPGPQTPLPVLLYIHGGGWVSGDLETHDVVCRGLALRAAVAVLAVDYRRSPEHRYPAALADCWTCAKWIFERGGEHGLDSSRFAVAGDSAGGNMATVLARWCYEREKPCRAQVLIYPILDGRADSCSYRRFATGYGLTADAMRWYWNVYLGPGGPGEPTADVSPLQAPSLAGLAPALIIACEFDPLHDEAIAYAGRLRDAGIEVDLIEAAGLVHGYFRMPGVFDRAHCSWDDCAAFLVEKLSSR